MIAKTEMEQLAYIASHDLREPLISIAGLASLIQKRCRLDGSGNRWLGEIVKITEQMEQKVDDLLQYSRTGRTVSKEDFQLDDVIAEAKRALVKPIQDSSAIIRIEGGPIPLKGDRLLTTQILQNLISNSIKYCRVVPEIVVKSEPCKVHQNYQMITVQDNGIGFDMRFKDRIFEVFQRLYTTDQYSGTGIGLALAKKAVELQGGSIWVESEIGKGTTFYFTLPC